MTQPAAVADVVDLSGYLNTPVTMVKVNPITSETTVDYMILSGALPDGVSLRALNATQA